MAHYSMIIVLLLLGNPSKFFGLCEFVCVFNLLQQQLALVMHAHYLAEKCEDDGRPGKLPVLACNAFLQ